MVTLVVEDGSGLSSANTYISLGDADLYFSNRGITTWADAEEEDRNTSLVRASAAIDYWFKGRWVGKKFTYAQALAWPRSDAEDEEGYEIPDDSVPNLIKYATAEVALIELTERFIQESVDSSNAVTSERVGPISVTYSNSAPSIKLYPHIDAMLRGLAATGGVQLGLSVGVSEEELSHCEGASAFNYPDYFNIVKFS